MENGKKLVVGFMDALQDTMIYASVVYWCGWLCLKCVFHWGKKVMIATIIVVFGGRC